MFIVLSEIGPASIGDTVEVFGSDDAQPTYGSIVELLERDGQPYARVELQQ
jgi:hypothetical protein